MLEIFLLFKLGKRLAGICREKGRAGWPWVVVMLVVYVGGLVGGAIAAGVVYVIANPNVEEPPGVVCVLGAYACAIPGLIVTYWIVKSLPPAEPDPGYGPEPEYLDDEPPPRRRRAESFEKEYDRRYDDGDRESRRRYD